MIRSICSALLTSILVSTILTYSSYTPVSERASDTMYTSVSGIFVFYAIYALPIILISGLLTDAFIWNRLKHLSTWVRFFVQSVLYGLFGILIGTILILTFTKEAFDVPVSLTIAASSALLYYLVSRLLERIFRRIHKKETPTC